MSDVQPAARDYRTTLFLPSTDFPMKAGLPQAEPKWLARWAAMDLYGRLRVRARAKDWPLFVLHDGPIYANGDIHSGTGLNHILKDFVVRSRTMMGFDAPYVPGWDCHGLPIEWKVEENFRSEGRTKDEIPKDELRRACREFAAHWMGVQREQIKRLGCIGAWDNPYTTMAFKAEAAIAREAMKFVDNGLLYRGFRPVMWSPIEKTALADAEVEYHEKTSPQIYVKFKVTVADDPELLGASIVIWTTTPWTIPANRAIAFSPDIAYGLYEVASVEDSGFGVVGERLLLARALADQTAKHAKLSLKHLRDVSLETMSLHGAHPLKTVGFKFDVPLLAGSHVTADTGTGFVHTAPGHGEDDYELYREHRDFFRNVPDPFNIITEDGSYAPDVPVFGGKRILTPEGKDGDANGAVIKELIAAGALLAKGSLRHSYPHSWRSKAPVIFRATPQWFVGIDKPMAQFGGETLRALALKAIGETKWYPPRGANRIGAMVEGRPDWVLSRQRAWGVPLAIFVNKASGQILHDAAVNARIVNIFEKEGADAWFMRPASDFLGSVYNPDDYEQVCDILDVWFDSGSTYVFTLENPIDPSWPKAEQADLYLEGSDQHRGWFQSSLLESVGTRGRAPYKAVLTHGFVLDEQGRKMSKSLGNTLAPQVIAEKHGAEILRLWAASSDFTEDLRIGQDIIKANVDSYRRLRNTIRFMLANLDGFDEAERIDVARMPELERFILARLAELDAVVREGYAAYDFNHVLATLFSFCTNELSAFYFDIRKDTLYCDAKSSIRRRAARTVLDEAFRRVLTWFAPILAFTMEEAWLLRFPGDDSSVHLQIFPATPHDWSDPALIEKWNRIRQLRRVVTGALEIERAAKRIGSSLEAAPTLYVSNPADFELLNSVPFAEIAITSTFEVKLGNASGTGSDSSDADSLQISGRGNAQRLIWPSGAFELMGVDGAAALVEPAPGHKCARCWMVLPEVGKNPVHDDLCNRCADAIEGHLS